MGAKKSLLSLQASASVVPWHDVENLVSVQGESSNLEDLPAILRDQWVREVDPNLLNKLQSRMLWDQLDTYKISEWNANSEKCNVDYSQTQKSSWLYYIEELSELLREKWNIPLLPTSQTADLPFIDIWLPIQAWAQSKLELNLASSNGSLNITDAALESISHGLLRRLCFLSEQALWHKFRQDKELTTFLLAHLNVHTLETGSISRSRYKQFVEENRRDGLKSLFSDFPVLARFVGLSIESWIANSTELLRRVQDDIQEISSYFRIPNDLELRKIHCDLSDFHQGGRSVAILDLTSSNSDTDNEYFRIVYKPKDLRTDKAFQDFLDLLNSKTSLPVLRTVRILERSDYGYMEYVEHQTCASHEELSVFYQNAGRLTFILYLLGCTDCHHENLVAAGEQLLLIDAETLFEPDTQFYSNKYHNSVKLAEPSELRKKFQASVLRTGLLPRWQIVGPTRLAIDSSALGISAPRQQTYKKKGWLSINTDGMLPGLVESPTELPTSLPIGIGENNPFAHYLDIYCKGFYEQSRALINLRDNWTGSFSIFQAFKGLSRRILVRGTHVYSSLQEHQLKPSALRSSFSQSLVLERLASGFLLEEEKPPYWDIFRYEVKQMNQLDIPLFTHKTDSDLFEVDSSKPPLSGLIKASGLSLAEDRLNTINTEEIDFQLSLIRGAVRARLSSTELSTAVSMPSEIAPTSNSASNYETRLSAESSHSYAQIIAERILSLAITDKKKNVEWLGMDLSRDCLNVAFGPVGTSLYGGSMGVACLLYSLLQRQDSSSPIKYVSDIQKDMYIETINSIIKPLKEILLDPMQDLRLRWWRDYPLGLAGTGGMILGLQQIGLAKLASDLLASCYSGLFDADNTIDILGGSAGLIGSLISDHTSHSFDLACMAANHICNMQREDGSWQPFRKNMKGLLGFSHGASGCAAALARMHIESSIVRYRDAALKALNYERSYFNQNLKNWPDLRHTKPQYMRTWCHGAPGIALARACLWGTALWDDCIENELNIALYTTAMSRPAYDHLCCGNLGILAILRILTQGPWTLKEEVMEHCTKSIDDIETNAYARFSGDNISLRCFFTQEGLISLPGFFNGMSGMGLVLMNTSHANQTVANLLTAGLWPLDQPS